MAVYAISDLHLSFAKDKPMDIFGDNWKNHPQKIMDNWQKTITEDDLVLMPGDISWAKNDAELAPDMEYILKLKGKKVILSGNHDYWWDSVSKLNNNYPEIFFLKNNFYPFNGGAICGTRGWLCPNDTFYTDHDEKIYLREANRLRLSIKMALDKGLEVKLVMLHFPPTNDKGENSLFVDIIKEYNIKNVIYGHLHGEKWFSTSLSGEIDGTNYSLVSADYLNFMPSIIKI